MKLDYVSRIKFGLKRYKTIATDKATSRVLDGSYNSIYKGRSMNFDELREYVPGDDIKDIDWKATSRSQKVLIRQYIAEKKHNLMLVMDTNRRMLAETESGEEKKDVALISGGSLAYMVSSNGDYVSAVFPNEKSLERFPFKMGTLNLEYILEAYAKAVTIDNDSSINKALEYIMRNIRRRMIIVIVTDIEGIRRMAEGILKQLVIVHDVLVINISDSTCCGKKVYNIENGSYMPAFMTDSKKLHRLLTEKQHKMIAECEDKLKHFGISMITIDSEDNTESRIIELLEKNKLNN
ncbi:MAG: DUF58 domain-containing protein [Saccharofermentans sp.]|nr:DUF58 domain-containing protein [Saccharofermentans sp.]